MQLFKRNSAYGPLALMGLGALALLGIVITASVLAGATAQLSANVSQARLARAAASDELETLLDAETGQRGFLLTDNNDYLTPYVQARDRATANFARLRQLESGNAAMQANMARLSQVSAAKLKELQQTVALFQAGHPDQALSIVNDNSGKVLMDQARQMLGLIIADTEQTVTVNLAQLNRNAALLRFVTLVGGLLVVLFSGAAMWLLIRFMRTAVRARIEVENLNQSLEDRVARRTSALQRANEEIQRFAYIVSHDLRAPLVNIMGFTTELEVGTKALKSFFENDTPETRAPAREAADVVLPEAAKFIRSSTGKMDRLINAILKLSREGRRELTAEMVDLRKIFETILASLKHQLDETDTEVELAPTLPVLKTDRLALEQVFGNLVDNAVKYLRPGRPGRLRILSENGRHSVTIRIIDNGRGIGEADLERVFELFRRAGRQDKPGEGIGLAHVRALVRRMGGDITVRSRLGEGSEFRVTLPRSLPTEASNPS